MNTVENAVKLQEVRTKFVEDTQNSKYLSTLNQCSKLEQEIIKTLALLDKQCNGKLNHLVSVYNAVKQNS